MGGGGPGGSDKSWLVLQKISEPRQEGVIFYGRHVYFLE